MNLSPCTTILDDIVTTAIFDLIRSCIDLTFANAASGLLHDERSQGMHPTTRPAAMAILAVEEQDRLGICSFCRGKTHPYDMTPPQSGSRNRSIPATTSNNQMQSSRWNRLNEPNSHVNPVPFRTWVHSRLSQRAGVSRGQHVSQSQGVLCLVAATPLQVSVRQRGPGKYTAPDHATVPGIVRIDNFRALQRPARGQIRVRRPSLTSCSARRYKWTPCWAEGWISNWSTVHPA